MSLSSLLRGACFLLGLIELACAYDPHPEEGKMLCSSNQCPQGYRCGSDNHCYTNLGGGSSICQPTRGSGSLPLIDSVSDGDSSIIQQDGRSGGWFTFNDGTGTQTPAPSQVTASPGKICTSGFGFTDWGAGLGVSLDSVGTSPNQTCAYDVTAYKGITFGIQGFVSGANLRFKIITAEIATVANGGTCVSTIAGNNCDDAYGVDISSTTSGLVCTSGNSSWICGPLFGASGPVTVTVPFSRMSQSGWGQVIALDLTKVLSLEWQFPAGTSGNGFNICISSLAFS